jgi:hypothetical protein
MAIQISTPEGNVLRQAKADAGTNPVDALTLAQVLTYLQNNVTDINSAKAYLAQLTKILFVLRADVRRKK